MEQEVVKEVVNTWLYLKFIGAGLMGFGALGAGIGVGSIFAAAVGGIARNPSQEKNIFKNAIIGAAMAEGLGIISLGLAAWFAIS